MDSKHTIELIGSTFELAGVAVLVIGSVLSFVRYIVSLIRFRDGPAAYRRLRLHLGRSIVLGLERGPWRDSLPVRSMGIAERSPFPYGAQFVTHLVRNIHFGFGRDEGQERESSLLEFLQYTGVNVLRRLQRLRRLRRDPGRGLTLNESGMYEVFMYPGLDILCVSAVGEGSHGWAGMLVH